MLITKKIDVSDIESLYEFIETPDFELTIPNGFKSQRIGLISRLSQFFITTQKFRKIPIYFSWLELSDPIKCDQIISDPACITAMLMADDFFDHEKKLSKKMMNSILSQRFMDSIYKKGRQIQLIAIDHSIERFSKPDSMYSEYNGKFSVRDASFYFELIHEFLEGAAKYSVLSNDDKYEIADLLAELIQNTDEHARVDYEQGLSRKSVRGVIISCHQFTRNASILNFSSENSPIYKYISSLRKDDRPLDVLEFSVFDSGPGLYGSFFKDKDKSMEDEYKVLSSCFREGISSKPNGHGVGRGLNKARRILDKSRSFVAIRSGRLSLFRDFNQNPLLDFDDPEGEDVSFYDEATLKRNQYTEMSSVEGTAYTILVPLK